MPKYGSKYISDPDEKIVSQSQLFINNKNEPNVFPRITTNVEDFRSLLSSEKLLGTDFEFGTKKIAGKEYYSPTIISVSSPDLTVGLRYSEELARECVRYIERGGRFVAHSALGADKPVLEGPLGIETPLEAWEDSMVVHYYANQALTKTTSKEVSDDAGALGYMGLWTAASLVTDLPNWKRCLHPMTTVLTERGWIKIHKLYEESFRGKVLSADSNGNMIWTTVADVFKNPLGDRTYYRVSYKNSLGCAIVTNDHTFLTNRGWVSADNLTTSDLVHTGTYEPERLDLIAGMWLGDGHLSRKGAFSIFHTSAQAQYLEAKASALKPLGLRPLRRQIDKRYPEREYLTYETISLPFFKELHTKDYYRWCLDNFTIASLAIWFFDDGTLHRETGRMRIACSRMPLEWVQKFQEKIEQLTGLDSVIHFDKEKHLICFSRKNSLTLSCLLARFATEDVRYKLVNPTLLPNYVEGIYTSRGIEHFAPVEVCLETSKVASKYKNVYCLSVPATENFVTRGGVVHNCTGLTCYSSGRVCSVHKPIEYCAVDSWAGLIIYLKQWEKLKSFNFSFDFYRSKMALGEICTRMQNTGLRVDRKYLKELEVTFEEKKESLFNYRLKPKTLKIRKELDRLQLPTDLSLAELKEIQEKLNDVTIDEDDFIREYVDFNPRSSTQILDYFNKNGIDLKKTDKKAVEKVLERLAVEAGYESIHDYAGQEQLSDVALNLYNVWLLKSEGKGTDPWFADKYFNWGQEDVLHPRWLSTGASSARLASSGPNVTNIPRVGFGELIRKAIIPHDPVNNEMYKADKSQLELRKVLHCAGVSPDALGEDAFTWLVEQSGDDFFKAAKEFDPAKYAKAPRDAARDIAKKFGHANSYLIGIDIIPYDRVDSPDVKRKIEAGLLVVYRKKYIPWLEKDWEYCGGIVAFTGKKLAETAYKITTPETIKKALYMQEQVYFKNFPFVRKWQMKVLEFIESHGYVQHSCGSFLELFGSPRENAKVAAGYIGQGESAHYMQELMLNYRALGIYPLLQVHDELVFERPRGASDEEIKEFFRPMRTPSKLFDGFSAPIEIKRGPNWKDLKLVGKI